MIDFPGVYRLKNINQWATSVTHNGKLIYLGSFDDPLLAALARQAWERTCPFDYTNCNREKLAIAIKKECERRAQG